MSDNISVALKDGSALQFSSGADAAEWGTKLRNEWSWLNSAGTNESRAAWGDIDGPLTQFIREATEYQRDPSDQRRARVESTASTISTLIKDGRLVTADNPLAEFILAQRESNERMAALIYYFSAAARANTAINVTRDVALALTRYSHYLFGIDPGLGATLIKDVESARDRQVALESSFSTTSQDVVNRVNDLADRAEERMDEVHNRVEEFLKGEQQEIRAVRADETASLKSSLDATLDGAREEIDSFKNKLQTEIALQSPIVYWDAKRKSHQISTIAFGVVLLVYVVAFGVVLYFIAHDITDGFVKYIEAIKNASATALGLFAIFVGLALALARVFYRLFSSQLHLWNDASERVTVIKTYLALAAGGHAKEEFLGALMTRLFTPTSDGVVKDDIASIGAVDGIVKSFMH